MDQNQEQTRATKSKLAELLGAMARTLDRQAAEQATIAKTLTRLSDGLAAAANQTELPLPESSKV